MASLNKKDNELISRAGELLKKRKSRTCGTACALRSKDNNVYLGINLGVENPSAVCAEPVAVGNMLTQGEKQADTIVAFQKQGITSPCGVCREMMQRIDIGNPWIIINKNKKIKLDKLLP